MTAHNMTCDYLVIGSGPGGAVTALLLAQAGHDVLVIEEGGGNNSFAPYSVDEMDAMYRHAGVSVILGNPKIAYLEGCCLGGASEINAGLYSRPEEAVLEAWQKEWRLQDFEISSLEPFFKANEHSLHVQAMPGGLGPGSTIIQRGARHLGWKYEELPRMWDYSVPGGGRQGMSRTFIPAACTAGARFLTRTKVSAIRFRGHEAVEAVCAGPEGQNNFRVRFKHVFICAGAVQTPLLLRRSGVKRNIGDHLKIAVSVRVVARFKDLASDPTEGVPVVQMTEFKPAMVVGGSFSGPAYLALWLAGRRDFADLMCSPSNLGLFYANINTEACGRIRAISWSSEAMVFMNVTDNDRRRLNQAAHTLGELLFASGANLVCSPVSGGNDFFSIGDMTAFLDPAYRPKLDLSTMHLFSSCPMGEDSSRAALDSFGRVHGLRNVYVNDGSMLPDAPGTNPQAIIMALARRNTTHWLKEHEDNRF